MRTYFESTKEYQDALSAVIRYLRFGDLRNLHERNTRILHWKNVHNWLEQDFAESCCARNGPEEKHSYVDLMRTYAQDVYVKAIAFQHVTYNSETSWVIQPAMV